MPSKNKNRCSKCGDKHYPPTGKKCTLWQETVKDNVTTVNKSHKGSSTVPDITMGPGNSFNKHKSPKKVTGSSTVPKTTMGPGNSSVTHKSPKTDLELSSEEEDAVLLQILKQLKRVNDRLDAVEEKVAAVATTEVPELHKTGQKDKKLSKHSSCKVDKKQTDKLLVSSSSESSDSTDSDDDSVNSIPNLNSLRTSINQSINQLSTCLISVSTDSKAHHPIHKA